MKTLFGEDDAPVTDPGFDQFYALYPRKKKPADARKAWRQMHPTPSLVQKILKDVELRKEHDWKGRTEEYIPYPATYLRAREFEGTLSKNGNGTKPINGEAHGKYARFVTPSKGSSMDS